jgi:hypothetical protein
MSSIRRFTFLRMHDGMARIRKLCGWCERPHTVRFPADDLLVARRHSSFCKTCSRQLEQALQDHPWLRGPQR